MDLEHIAELKIRYKWLLDKASIYALCHPNLYNILVNNVPVTPPADGSCPWSSLPEDICKVIFSKIEDVRTLYCLAQVNKLFQKIIMQNEDADELFWEPLRRNVGIVALFMST